MFKKFGETHIRGIFNFMILSNLLNCCQVDFGSNNSCVNQLILITNNTDGAFDTNPFLEVPGVILDLLKGFGKI